MNKHNLPLTRHAANEYGGWVKIVIWLSLFHCIRARGLQLRGCMMTEWLGRLSQEHEMHCS